MNLFLSDTTPPPQSESCQVELSFLDKDKNIIPIGYLREKTRFQTNAPFIGYDQKLKVSFKGACAAEIRRILPGVPPKQLGPAQWVRLSTEDPKNQLNTLIPLDRAVIWACQYSPHRVQNNPVRDVLRNQLRKAFGKGGVNRTSRLSPYLNRIGECVTPLDVIL